ncbi:MAG: hypothetical protein ACKVP7_15690 [Hyphomicrobiaceae bacterium]
MQALDQSEAALLELLAIEPPSYLPPRHRATIRRLDKLGLAVRWQNRWYPTAAGLVHTGRTVH